MPTLRNSPIPPTVGGSGLIVADTVEKELEMDWDSIGMFALFLSSGAVTLGVIALRAYNLHLNSGLERERLKHDAEVSQDVTEELAALDRKVDQLTERLDFTERLLASGEGRAVPRPDSPPSTE